MLPRILKAETIVDAIVSAYEKLTFEPDPQALKLISQALDREKSPLAREILSDLLKNAQIAKADLIPPCQDTGTQVVFAEIGTELYIEGELLEDLVNRAIKLATDKYYLRSSVCLDPLFDRKSKDANRPAVFHVKQVPGDKLSLHIAQKGGGAENMSRVYMLSPGAGRQAIIDKAVETVKLAGGKACPPLILGIGIGGNFESCALLAKRALFVPLDEANPDPNYAALEQDILAAVNATGIGAMALGGNTTALAVKILTYPCHIASLPLAINLQCHSHRHITLDF